jgi:hypothetical protein
MRRVIELIVGAALLYSGLVHAANPILFVGAVSAYDLVPSQMAALTAFLLPHLMIAVGLYLAVGIYKETALKIAAVLFAVFFIAQLWAWLSGKTIDCGCFGYSTQPVGLTTLAIPALLGIASILLLRTRVGTATT